VPQCKLLVLCQSTAVDSSSNLVSLQGLIQVFTLQKPFTGEGFLPGRFVLFSLWSTDSDEPVEIECRVRIVAPDGKENVAPSFKFAVKGPRHRHHTNLNGFPIVGLGENRIVMDIRDGKDWIEAAFCDILVQE
jgi:hypothetical protein